ncbi:alpha/beta fold hydrolase [Nostoc sp. CHAB 5715]|uniref:alpha/beta fold hydrolase n=1 Tax=Nostoc sp. CHAB 5715 TaxID=2780400 RepID=UPI001E59E5BF|nr:alpha/beta hydrolase [Nostoc sp. CHAB 5715]MCC5622324.1 alpha/beta hydrolase [Nostoc sp. CHAB 5715]
MDLAFVLIHGGGLDTWVWGRITPLLDFPALAVRRAASGTNLNHLTITDSAKYIQSQIESAGFQRVILVAHSIGGILAPTVASLLPQRVVHIVFVGANIPPEGSSAISIFRPSERFGIAVWLRLMAWKISFMNKAVEADMQRTLCNDMDEATVQQVLAGGKNPEPPAIFYEPVSRLQMPSVPCTYIKLLQDQGILPPSKQDEMAANIGAKVVTLNTGHTAMLSRPHELAKLLNDIASETTAKKE